MQAEIEDDDALTLQNGKPKVPVQSQKSLVSQASTDSTKSSDGGVKVTKVRRKSSTTKGKPSTPTTLSTPSTPKNFVAAKPIGNPPPPREF